MDEVVYVEAHGQVCAEGKLHVDIIHVTTVKAATLEARLRLCVDRHSKLAFKRILYRINLISTNSSANLCKADKCEKNPMDHCI